MCGSRETGWNHRWRGHVVHVLAILRQKRLRNRRRLKKSYLFWCNNTHAEGVALWGSAQTSWNVHGHHDSLKPSCAFAAWERNCFNGIPATTQANKRVIQILPITGGFTVDRLLLWFDGSCLRCSGFKRELSFITSVWPKHQNIYSVGKYSFTTTLSELLEDEGH